MSRQLEMSSNPHQTNYAKPLKNHGKHKKKVYKYKANTKGSIDGYNVKKIQTDCNCGFWKLVSLTVFQSSLLLCVTFDLASQAGDFRGARISYLQAFVGRVEIRATLKSACVGGYVWSGAGNAWGTYLFDTKLWFCHSQVISQVPKGILIHVVGIINKMN